MSDELSDETLELTTPSVTAEPEPVTEPQAEPASDEPRAEPQAVSPHVRQAQRILQRLARMGTQPHPRMVACEAAHAVLIRLVNDGTLSEPRVQALMEEAQCAVLSDFLVALEEEQARAKPPQPTRSPQRRLEAALTRAARPGGAEQTTASGIILPGSAGASGGIAVPGR